MALDDTRKEMLLALEENKILNEWFDHPGFKIFAEKARVQLDRAKDIRYCQSEKDLHMAKGKIDILEWFLTFPSVLKDVLLEQVEEAEKFVERVRKSKNG